MLRNLSKLVCLLCILTSIVDGRRDFKEKIEKSNSQFFPEDPKKPTPPPPPVSCPCVEFSTLESVLNQDGVVIDRERSCQTSSDACQTSSDASLGEVFGIFAAPPPGSSPPLNYAVSFDRLTCQSIDSIQSLSSRAEADACKDLLVKTCESLPPPPPPPPVSCPCTEFSSLSSVLNQDGVVIDTKSSCKTFFDADRGDDVEFGIFADPPPGSRRRGRPAWPLDYVVSFDRMTCQSVDTVQFLSSEAEADACKDLLVDTCRELSIFPPGSCPCDFTNDLLDTHRQDGIIIDREKSCKVTYDMPWETLGIFGWNGRNALNFYLNSDSFIHSCITQGDQLIVRDVSSTQIDACKNDLFESCIELKIPISASCPCFTTNELVDYFNIVFVHTDFEKSCIFTDDPTGSVGIYGYLGQNYFLNFNSRSGQCILPGDRAWDRLLSPQEVDACKKDLMESCVELEIPIKKRPPPSCPCDFTNDLLDTFTSDFIITDFENSCIFTDDPTGTVGVFGGNGRNDLSYSLSFDSMGGSCRTQGDQFNPDVLSTREVDSCKKDLKESCAKLGIPASCPCGFSNDLLKRLRQDDVIIDPIKSCKFDNSDPELEMLGIFATDLNGDALIYDLIIEFKSCGIERNGNAESIRLSSEQIVNACTKDLLESCVELGIPTPPRPPVSCPCDFTDGLIDFITRNDRGVNKVGSCDFTGSDIRIRVDAAFPAEGINRDFSLDSDKVVCTTEGNKPVFGFPRRRIDACKNDLLESCVKLKIPITGVYNGAFRSEL